MERREGRMMQDAILTGYRDLAGDRVFASSGDFKADMAALDETLIIELTPAFHAEVKRLKQKK